MLYVCLVITNTSLRFKKLNLNNLGGKGDRSPQ
uniref:Uncharacterized protein n=1 Tax=Anguilla anguilla TaxID=7936 RepID=A0A0E9VNY2_ANGAN